MLVHIHTCQATKIAPLPTHCTLREKKGQPCPLPFWLTSAWFSFNLIKAKRKVMPTVVATHEVNQSGIWAHFRLCKMDLTSSFSCCCWFIRHLRNFYLRRSTRWHMDGLKLSLHRGGFPPIPVEKALNKIIFGVGFPELTSSRCWSLSSSGLVNPLGAQWLEYWVLFVLHLLKSWRAVQLLVYSVEAQDERWNTESMASNSFTDQQTLSM